MQEGGILLLDHVTVGEADFHSFMRRTLAFDNPGPHSHLFGAVVGKLCTTNDIHHIHVLHTVLRLYPSHFDCLVDLFCVKLEYLVSGGTTSLNRYRCRGY